jgi:hypothetical protein
MEIVLLIKIYSKDRQIELDYSKTYNSALVPSIGAKIKDDLFAELKEIIEIVFDYSKDQCLVTLEPREETIERLEGHIQEVASMHNWILVENKMKK